MKTIKSSFLTGEPSPVVERFDENIEIVDDPSIGPYAISAEAKSELDGKEQEISEIASLIAARKARGFHSVPFLCSSAGAGASSVDGDWLRLRIGEIVRTFPRGIALLDESLVNLSHFVRHPSDKIPLRPALKWLLYSPSDEAGNYVVEQLAQLGYIAPSPFGTLPSNRFLQITAKGWGRLEQLDSHTFHFSRQAFVAMAFDSSTQSIFDDGLAPALKELGLTPLRIDRKEHNNKICDEIIAEIRRSRILVADFTLNRGGVYYEAGFAQGIGVPVIWTVHEDSLEKVHFDTRRYNHILYSTPQGLRGSLVNRVRATLPQMVTAGSLSR